MRVALFTETYLPYVNGVVTHVKVLKEGLEKLGHDVLVVCANPDTNRYFVKDGVLNCPGVSFKKFYNYGLASPISPLRHRYIKAFNPDIIHIHNEFGVGYSGATTAKYLDVPLVYTYHTMYDEYLYYVAPKRLIPLAKKTSHAYEKALAERATVLTGPSKKVEEHFKSIGILNRPIYVIPNPVEVDVFTPDCTGPERIKEIRDSFDVADDETLVCFCGRLGKEKSVDVMLKYWARTVKPEDRFKLLIIGDGPSYEELVNLSDELGISSMVSFAGKIMHNDLPPYYAAADLYLTTSLSDTNSISMLEAMATGLPVLHIADELNKGQVVDGLNGYIFKNADEMYQHMQAFKNMPDEQKNSLKRAARESVMQSGAETLAKNLLDVYELAIKTKKTKSEQKAQ